MNASEMMKGTEIAAAIGVGNSQRIVICGTNCSKCDKANAQLFSTFEWRARKILIANGRYLPVGVPVMVFTPAVADVEAVQAGKYVALRLCKGTKAVNFKKVNGAYTLAQFVSTITTK